MTSILKLRLSHKEVYEIDSSQKSRIKLEPGEYCTNTALLVYVTCLYNNLTIVSNTYQTTVRGIPFTNSLFLAWRK